MARALGRVALSWGSVVIGLWCALLVHWETRSLPPWSVVLAPEPAPRVAVWWTWDPAAAAVRVHWRWLEPATRVTLVLRGDGGRREWRACVSTWATECVVPALGACSQYWVALEGARTAQLRWHPLLLGALVAHGGELICNGDFAADALHWRVFLGSPRVRVERVVHRAHQVPRRQLVLDGRGGVSQMVRVLEPPRGGATMLSVHVRASVSGCGVAAPDVDASVWLDVHYADGSAARNIQAILLHKRDVSRLHSATLALGATTPVRAVRVAILFGCPLGALRLDGVSLRFEGSGAALAPRTVAAPPLHVLETLVPPAAPVAPLVGVATQVAVEGLDALRALVAAWQGPVSAAVLVRGPRDVEAVRAWYHLHGNEWLDLHVAQGAQALATRGVLNAYPVNALRNVAAAHSRAQFVWELDADCVPCPGARRALERAVTALPDRSLLVVPIFDLAGSHVQSPSNKVDLVHMIDSGLVLPSASHSATNVYRWYHATSNYHVRWQRGWEPSGVLRAQSPSWDERFVGVDLFHRAARAWHLRVHSFRFTVAHDVWAMRPPTAADASDAAAAPPPPPPPPLSDAGATSTAATLGHFALLDAFEQESLLLVAEGSTQQ